MKADYTRPPPSDWTIGHPWAYIYTVIVSDLLILLFFMYLIEHLKGTLP